MVEAAMSTVRDGHLNDLYCELSKPEMTCVARTRGMCSIIPFNPLYSVMIFIYSSRYPPNKGGNNRSHGKAPACASR